jgi:hypothetical protein
MSYKDTNAKQTQNRCDRFHHFDAPCFTIGTSNSRSWFRGGFIGSGKWFRRIFRFTQARSRAALTIHANGRGRSHPSTPQIPDSPAAFLESCRGHPGTNDATQQLWVRGDRGSPYEKRLSRCCYFGRSHGCRPRSLFRPIRRPVLPESIPGFCRGVIRAMSDLRHRDGSPSDERGGRSNGPVDA